ncbi:MAG: protoporphyrinogen oxidase HemJ [Pseudomonadota bacterium]
MLWLKAFHLIFMVTWFAGLFYLPRLYVYHAMTEDEPGRERFKIMERKLFWGIMTPGGVVTLVLGFALLAIQNHWLSSGWLHAKLLLIGLLVAYHIWCGKLLMDFKHDRNRHSHVWYRWFNEAPVLALIAIILLASLKPF